MAPQTRHWQVSLQLPGLRDVFKGIICDGVKFVSQSMMYGPMVCAAAATITDWRHNLA